MRKVIVAIILITGGLCTSAQDSLIHKSAIVYGFKDFSIILVSQLVTDSSLIQSRRQTQPASRERVVSIYGNLFKIFLATNTASLPDSVTRVAFDTDTKNHKPAAIEDLEMQVHIIPAGPYKDTTYVKDFPLLPRDSSISFISFTKGIPPAMKGDYYVLLQRMVFAYNTRIISIRNKKTKEEVLNFRLNSLDKPVLPFLTLVTQFDSEKRLIDSFFSIEARSMVIPDMKSILNPNGVKQVPIKVQTETKILTNENLHETSDLVLFFKKQRHMYPDSSMEYRLSSETNNDTNWIKTGHRLVVSHLVPGDHYRLQVRYELHPAHIQEHTFYIVPKWYQATQTKIIFISLLILTGLFAWLLLYKRRLNKSKRQREQLSLEIRSIRSQLNPHFIFNALSSIQGLINKNDIPAANRYLTEFSTLLRDALHNTDKDMVPLVTEINLLETYLKLEQLRFNFKYEINIDEAINKNATEIPNLILQPLVENAVKHGVSSLAEKGSIKIDFLKSGHELLVSIADNGNKFDGAQPIDGFGLKLTKNRISLLSQTLKEQPIKLTIERKQNMETVVNLAFSNWI
jgi:hypothetical protein